MCVVGGGGYAPGGPGWSAGLRLRLQLVRLLSGPLGCLRLALALICGAAAWCPGLRPSSFPIGCGYQSGRRCVCSMCRCCVSCVCGGVYVDSFTWGLYGRVIGCYCLHFSLSANNSFRTMPPFSPCCSGCLRWCCPGLRRGASLPVVLAASSASGCALAALVALYAVVRLLGVIVPAPSVCARPGGFLWLSVNLCAASGPRYARECLRLSLRR